MANAFEIYAFDYLVKPFNIQRVKKTLSKIRDIVNENGNKGNIDIVSPESQDKVNKTTEKT